MKTLATRLQQACQEYIENQIYNIKKRNVIGRRRRRDFRYENFIVRKKSA